MDDEAGLWTPHEMVDDRETDAISGLEHESSRLGSEASHRLRARSRIDVAIATIQRLVSERDVARSELRMSEIREKEATQCAEYYRRKFNELRLAR